MTYSDSALNTLQNISVRNLKKAEEQLAEANKQLLKAADQHTMLQEYRQDYLVRCMSLMTEGMKIDGLRNYQSFVAKLDQAIIGQKGIEDHCAEQVRQSLQLWQDCQKKKLSYEVLSERLEQRVYALEIKKDQKLMDEFASRAKKYAY